MNSPAMDAKSICIRTNRLRLVPLTERFLYDLFRSYTPDIAGYLVPQPYKTLGETLEFIRDSQLARQQGTAFDFAVVHAVTQEFLGYAGLRDAAGSTPDLGVWIKKSFHGHGYGKEAVLGLMEFAQAYLQVDGFIYRADRRNLASRRIPESAVCAMVVGRTTQISESGKMLDVLEYRLPVQKTPCDGETRANASKKKKMLAGMPAGGMLRVYLSKRTFFLSAWRRFWNKKEAS